jgi:UDP-N-acetylmuramoylalanine--D-glutamate ligase
LPGLVAFKGLPHRCEIVGEANSVLWVNDSKGTNVGATEAALRGIGGDQNVVLIVGGVGKDQDFTPLRSAVEQHCRRVLTMGEVARELELALGNVTPTQRVPDLSAAIDRAGQLARSGDIVLLSPACASFDMFVDFQARGDCFKKLVQQHLATAEVAQ